MFVLAFVKSSARGFSCLSRTALATPPLSSRACLAAALHLSPAVWPIGFPFYKISFTPHNFFALHFTTKAFATWLKAYGTIVC